MLSAELRGEAYSKASHRRRLLPLLSGRTEGAIERKHGNISAVLMDLGMPYIAGYKAYSNYQQLLFDVVSSRLELRPDVESLVAADVEAAPFPPMIDDILSSLVQPPARNRKGAVGRGRRSAESGFPGSRSRVNYLKRESENQALGEAGESFVLEYERARLLAAGRGFLASKVEHVSKTRGDGDGFDILSYDESGREKLIEVKTTKYGAQTPFFVTANELRVSEKEADRYSLYRVHEFRTSPKLFTVPGSFSAQFDISPTEYLARLS